MSNKIGSSGTSLESNYLSNKDFSPTKSSFDLKFLSNSCMRLLVSSLKYSVILSKIRILNLVCL